LLGAFALGAVVMWFTEAGKTFVAFARESWEEAKRVVWPTRKETLQTTGVVFAFVFVMALFLWITDKTLEWLLYDLILGWKR
jgi:preprotein translocase subunit SecE